MYLETIIVGYYKCTAVDRCVCVSLSCVCLGVVDVAKLVLWLVFAYNHHMQWCQP